MDGNTGESVLPIGDLPIGEIEVVRLRNGSEEILPIVAAISSSIEDLMREGVGGKIALFEAVKIARDLSHKPFGKTGEKLIEIGILDQNGSMHESIRNIVLSSIIGERMEFVNPIVSA